MEVHEMSHEVIGTLPHDTEAFTEGLVLHRGKLIEGTGLNDKSWIAEVDRSSGEHAKKISLPGEYFGEGITVLNQKIYQLTYQNHTCFIYDAATYEKLGEFRYDTEGWGLTHDGTNLIMSDGSHLLYYLDTTTFQVARTLNVKDQTGGKLTNLNELEYVNGYIFANVHETSFIVKIDPATGEVIGQLDLSLLANEIKQTHPNSSWLNGIAYDEYTNSLLVTGKLWPKAYVIRLK
jgi:glutamine cyclotransferase